MKPLTKYSASMLADSSGRPVGILGPDGNEYLFGSMALQTIVPYATLVANFAAATYTGLKARVSEGFTAVSDGVGWVPDGVQTLFRSAMPVGSAPTGTMGDNGAVTLGTALPNAYAACYLHFPANAISAGSAAGLYYMVMSSTTVGQVFNNTYTSGVPAAPATPTAFVTTGPGAYTASTSSITFISLTVPGALMGLNGAVDSELSWSETNTANNKTHMVSFGGTNLLNSTLASVASFHAAYAVVNRGSASSQVSRASASTSGGGWGSNTVSPTYLSINTAADVTLAFGGTKATATDWHGIETFVVKVNA
jgi:hypothetical protein